MAWFFTDSEINSDNYIITGENAKHIAGSLRMKQGEARCGFRLRRGENTLPKSL